MDAVQQLAPTIGIESACDVLGVARASFYRKRPVAGSALPAPPPMIRPTPARALRPDERQAVRAVLNSERFQDCAPAAIHATLLDEGQYLCSTRTMYRVLEEDGATGERRDQLIHPPYQKPELLATAPNQLWSWDITKLRGPAKWTYFYLYVILDVFSRYVVGWMVAPGESAALAKKLIQETCDKQNIQPDQLGLHADRGSAMRSKPVALLLADLAPRPTADPTLPTTIHIRKASSVLSSIGPSFPIASAAFRIAAPSAKPSSRGITTSTAIPALE